MQKLLPILITTLISAPLLAQDHFYLGPQATYQFWDKSRFLPGLDDDNGVQLGINLGYEFAANSDIDFAPKTAFELVAQTSASDTNAEADVYEFNTYFFGNESSFGTTPYFVAGISKVKMESDVVIDDSTTNMVLGFGISKYLGDYLEMKYDIRWRHGLSDQTPGDINDVGLTIAFNHHFGRSSQAAPAVVAPAPAPVPTPTPVVERAPTPAPAPAPAPEPQLQDVTVRLDVLFATNSSIITDMDDAEFRRMADALVENPDLSLTIEGHTDSDGTAEYNQTLSQRRADRVRDTLISRYGVSADRVTAIGYGEERPISDNNTATGKAQNRRVVGVISYQVAQ